MTTIIQNQTTNELHEIYSKQIATELEWINGCYMIIDILKDDLEHVSIHSRRAIEREICLRESWIEESMEKISEYENRLISNPL